MATSKACPEEGGPKGRIGFNNGLSSSTVAGGAHGLNDFLVATLLRPCCAAASPHRGYPQPRWPVKRLPAGVCGRTAKRPPQTRKAAVSRPIPRFFRN